MSKKKNSLHEELRSLIGNIYMYRGREVRVEGFYERDGEIVLANQGNDIITPLSNISDTLDELLPVDEETGMTANGDRSTAQMARDIMKNDGSSLDEMSDIIKDNIKKIKDDPKYIDQAKAISDQVGTLVDMAKLKVQMLTELRKHGG